MNLHFQLVADFANVDAAGKLNIIGAFNRITVPEFPATHRLMYLVMRLGVELGEFNVERKLRVILYDEDATEQWSTHAIPLTASPREGHTVRRGEFNPIIAISDLEFKKPGRYEFRIFIDNDMKGAIPLDVSLRSDRNPEA